MQRIIFSVLLLLTAFSLVLFLSCDKGQQKKMHFDDSGKTDLDESSLQEKKLIVVQSYWTHYQWGIDIEKGVLEALGLPELILAEEPGNKEGFGVKEGIAARVDKFKINLKIVNMDTKRRSDDGWKNKSGRKTISEIEAFKPDVVILADDNARQYVW